MELFSSNIKKLQETETPKLFLHFRKWNFLVLILKKHRIFSQTEAFAVFPEMEPCNFLAFFRLQK